MSRFFRGAVRALVRATGLPDSPLPYSGLFLATSFPSAAGHLGLVRALPALRDLNALLTPEAFLLDATHALGAATLRIRPTTGEATRVLLDITTEDIAKAEADKDAKDAGTLRLAMALVYAGDGRLEDALDALSRVAAERPGSHLSRLFAAAICDLLGRVDEGHQWLAGIPEDQCPCGDSFSQLAFVAATLGGAPGAVAGSEDRVASAAFQLLDDNLWSNGFYGGMSVVKKLLIMGLLKRMAKAEHKDAAVPLFSELKRVLKTGMPAPLTP